MTVQSEIVSDWFMLINTYYIVVTYYVLLFWADKSTMECGYCIKVYLYVYYLLLLSVLNLPVECSLGSLPCS